MTRLTNLVNNLRRLMSPKFVLRKIAMIRSMFKKGGK